MTESQQLKKKNKVELTFKNKPLTILCKEDYNFFNQKFNSLKKDNKIDLHEIIESLDSKNFSKQIFNYLLKIENEKVLQSILEKFFEIFFEPIFQSQNTKTSFNLLFEDSAYNNILHRKYLFFPYNFSIAIYQQKLIDSVITNQQECINLLSKVETKKVKIPINKDSASLNNIIKNTKKNYNSLPQSYLNKVKERLNALIESTPPSVIDAERTENKEDAVSFNDNKNETGISQQKTTNDNIKEPLLKDIDTKILQETYTDHTTNKIETEEKIPKNPIEKSLFNKNREKYAEILNPERFFDDVTKFYLSKLSNLYTQESLLYLSVLLRIVPFNKQEKLNLIKEKNLFVKLLDAENYQVRIQTLITMFLFIDSVELFEAYFDSFIDSLYDESDLVIDVASEFIKLLCFKYKSSIVSEAFLSLEFMIKTSKEKYNFKEKNDGIYLLKDANLQLTLLSSVNSNYKFLKYLHELENYAIQIKELIFCIKNNFDILKSFFIQIFNYNKSIEELLNTKVALQDEVDFNSSVVLNNLSLKMLIEKFGQENIVFIPLLILFVENGLRNKKFNLTANENKKRLETFTAFYGDWFHEISFKSFCCELKTFHHIKYLSRPESELLASIKNDSLDMNELKLKINYATKGLKNYLFLRALLDYFIVKESEEIKEIVVENLRNLKNQTNYLSKFIEILNFINSADIIFFEEIFKTKFFKHISTKEDLIAFDEKYNLLFIEKYIYTFKIIEIKRVNCFSREFKFKFAFFGDKNPLLFYRIPNSIKNNSHSYFKVDTIVEGVFNNESDDLMIELIIKKDVRYIVVDKEFITLSKSLL